MKKNIRLLSIASSTLIISLLSSGCFPNTGDIANNVPSKSSVQEHFDGQSAMNYLRYQVSLGPRPAGSKASQELSTDIERRLQSLGAKIERQTFQAQTPLGPKNMTNLIATWQGKNSDCFIIGAHYDTKYFEEGSFLGANDGASGVAILMQLAQNISRNPLSHTIKLVFLDGEEAFKHWNKDDSLYGSRYFVRELVSKNQVKNVKAVFIVDMVGDKELKITDEYFSDPNLKKMLRSSAKELNLESYFPEDRLQAIDDDHIPFIESGIPSVNIIGFYCTENEIYPQYWHTLEDTLDKVSHQSLQIVGSVLLRTLRKLDHPTAE